jgi:MFS family permease
VSNLLVGLAIKYTYRYRVYSLIGVPIYVTGLLLTTFFRGPSNPLSYVLLSQIVTGVGGGMFHVPVQLGIQAVANHQEVGIATAMFLTFTSLGGSVGSAIAGAIWTGLLPEKLEEYLPDMSAEERMRIYDDFKFAMSFPRGSVEREGIVSAYVDVMKRLTRTATLAALPMMVFVLAMKEVPLERQRSRSISNHESAGIDDDDEEDEIESPQRFSHPRRISTSSRRPPNAQRQQSWWWRMGSWVPRHRRNNDG